MKPFLLKIWRALPDVYWLRMGLLGVITQRFLVGISGLVLNAEGEVWLLYHTYRKEYPWGLPGGWLKKGEQPAAALEREIGEETGLKVNILRPLTTYCDPLWPRLEMVYLCAPLQGAITPSDEVSAAGYFSLEALPKLLPSQAALIRKLAQELSQEKNG